MKNIPKKIYLQTREADTTNDNSVDDFDDLYNGLITWNTEKIYQNDIEYILNDDNNVNESDLIEFAMFVTGHDEQTISEMYEYWKR